MTKIKITKTIVDGDCSGEAVFIDRYISFFGEVDPREGIVLPEKNPISGKALVFKGSRGSTVGSYIIYALKYYGKHPICMIVYEAEPILIAGCILADIPLFVVKEDYSKLKEYLSGSIKPLIHHRRGEETIELGE